MGRPNVKSKPKPNKGDRPRLLVTADAFNASLTRKRCGHSKEEVEMLSHAWLTRFSAIKRSNDLGQETAHSSQVNAAGPV